MRFSTAFVAFLSTAHGLSLFGGDRASISNEDLKIPGNTTLELCAKDNGHEDDIVVIERVDLTPSPPQAGQELLIQANGTVLEKIEEGAYVSLEVKYGLIRLIKTQADLCEQLVNVDEKCPIEKGYLSITKTVELPREIPKGKYTVRADVFTVDDKPITCLTATVVLGYTTAAEISEL